MTAAEAGDESSALRLAGIACERGERLLFSDINVTLDRGDGLQVCGPNGCGKTTLLRILCGLTLPTEGEVHWRGVDIAREATPFRSQLQYVGHANGVKLDLTARENLRCARALSGTPSPADAEAILGRLRLRDFADTATRALSAGQRRRLALARLLASRAELWVLDEPFTSLDTAGVGVVQEILHEHLADGGLAVYSSHQPLTLPGRRVRQLELQR